MRRRGEGPLLLLAAGALLTACSNSAPTTPAPVVPPVAIMVTGAVELGIGQTTQLKVITSAGVDVTPAATWSTADRLVATVSTSGVVTGVRAGTVAIVANYGAASALLSMVVDLVRISSPTITSCGAIVAPGSYTLGKDLTLTVVSGTCLTVQASGVHIDCANHNVGGMRISNASDVVVNNCTFVTEAVGSEQSFAFVTNSRNVTFERNKLSSIVLHGGSDNRVVGNTIDGGYDGSGRIVGQDDGVILNDESNDTIEGNTIRNVYDAGIEGVDAVSNTRIVNNLIDNTGSTGISSYWCTAWTGNTVNGNIVTRSPGLVRFVYKVSDTKCSNTLTVGAFLNNSFVGNHYNLPLALQQSRGSMSFDLPEIAGRVANNLIRDNEMGTAAGPFVNPESGFIDGGGNICGAFSSTFCGGPVPGLVRLTRRPLEKRASARHAEQGPGQRRGHQRHDNEHREDARRQDPKVVAEVERDELHQAPRVHQRSDRKRVRLGHARPARGPIGPAQLARDCHEDDAHADAAGTGATQLSFTLFMAISMSITAADATHPTIWTRTCLACTLCAPSSPGPPTCAGRLGGALQLVRTILHIVRTDP